MAAAAKTTQPPIGVAWSVEPLRKCITAELVPAGVPQMWHGYGQRTWEVLAGAQAAGVDTRVGLEDVRVLPDGRSAADNAQLVAAALALTSGAGS